jgi:hypothetical protein
VAHWKEGGHKKECRTLKDKAASVAAASTTTLRTAPSSATTGSSESSGGSCTICLDKDPPPIQSGCACRGDAGLAHVECRAQAAAHRMRHTDPMNILGWGECATCGQRFTGPMQLGLAEAWWSQVRTLPPENEERTAAANVLAIALHRHGMFSRAEILLREVRLHHSLCFTAEPPRGPCYIIHFAHRRAPSRTVLHHSLCLPQSPSRTVLRSLCSPQSPHSDRVVAKIEQLQLALKMSAVHRTRHAMLGTDRALCSRQPWARRSPHYCVCMS